MTGGDRFAAAVETENAGIAIEGAEHDNDPAVLAKVGDGFRATAGVFLVGDFHGAENAEGIASFGREVDVAGGGERRAGNEEDALLLDPLGKFGIDIFALFAHFLRSDLKGIYTKGD